MTTGSVVIVVVLTLVIYSVVGTITYLISKENETVAIAFGLGIAGLTVVGLAKLIHVIRNRFKYHIGKRSIFEDAKTKQRYRCETKDANAVSLVGDYVLIERYAKKSKWKPLPGIDKAYIHKARKESEEYVEKAKRAFNI